MKVDVHIERLVLDGFDFSSRDVDVVRLAVESELARLIAAHDGPPRLTGSLATLRGGAMPVGAGAGAAPFGTHVARSVWSGLNATEGTKR